MAIEITGFPTAKPHTADDGGKVEVARNDTPAKQPASGKTSTSDTVSLTDTAARLRSLENSLASLPVVDLKRVEGIKQAIVEGTFEINPVRIADKMLSFERSLSA